MTTFTPDYLATKARIAATLSTAGWTVASPRDMEVSCQIAQKDYQTAVGVKTATISLEPWSTSLMVVGNYQSEGRNALSTNSLMVNPEMADAGLAEAVAKYVAGVDKEVDGTYARRLHLNYPQSA
ncbi:hypothetical protein H8F21_13915 [Pseudomonas sp. P66]|uniref:Lipoprotein n=1 Tax=Pseudomonas arcuscaelestis TaxID=2710591 RepID=A0ABS2BYH3_9PSED|nr:hypothetical protein [Pseudomonas arcuscaelestis]MBM5458662.1 hypothetical protein [Pseudomonas arcuscaelestis]